jgi:hypothetical protein
MDANEKPIKRPSYKIAFFQGFAFIFLSLFAGVVCPMFTFMAFDPEGEDSWKKSVLMNLHWHWTLPIGILLAVLTYLISSKLPPTAKAVFGLLVGLFLLAIALSLSWLMLSV